MHDWSKFHPTEFFESVKYYQGDKSPIPVCKKENGVSYAWQHHKGHNPHHYEYWTDNFDGRGKPTYHKIPYEYLMEMLADWFAAGRTYIGKEFTPYDEIQWWKLKRDTIAMHPMIIKFIDDFMDGCHVHNRIEWFDYNKMKRWYNRIYNEYEKD